MITREAALWMLYEEDPAILRPDSEHPYDRRCPIDYVPTPENWTTRKDQEASREGGLDVTIADQANVITDEEVQAIIKRQHNRPMSGRLG